MNTSSLNQGASSMASPKDDGAVKDLQDLKDYEENVDEDEWISNFQYVFQDVVNTNHVALLRKLSSQWPFYDTKGYVLSNKYTPTNLHFRNLKGYDSEVVNLLKSARDVDGNPLFIVCLLLLSKKEIGDVEYTGDGYRRRYNNDDYDEGDDASMGEIQVTNVTMDYWIGPNDKRIPDFDIKFEPSSAFRLNDKCFDDEEDLFDEDHDEKIYQGGGYTGNDETESCLEYIYHKGAVVFWPAKMNTEVGAFNNMNFVISYFLSDQYSASQYNPSIINRAKVRMKHLLKATKKRQPAFSWCQPNANFPGSQGEDDEVNEFLCSDKETETFDHFEGIEHARNWASKYFGNTKNKSYSGKARAFGGDGNPRVEVTKTHTRQQSIAFQYQSDVRELRSLQKIFGSSMLDEDESEGSANLKRSAEESTQNCRKSTRRDEVVTSSGTKDDPISLD